MTTQDDLFQPVIELPEPVRADRYRRLIGLDDIKTRLRKEAMLLADPQRLQLWAEKFHGPEVAATTLFTDRAPLFVFAGDVGCGKSALAESFGCDLADALDLPVYLYRLKLATRGSGLVGEMTALIGAAFEHLHLQGAKSKSTRGINAVSVLVVDEADALVQSRENQQMHHEDRAGVDAFLAGVDSLAGAQVPVLVVLCTNRLGALDPAIMRRAAATFVFDRPDSAQRLTALRHALHGIDVPAATLNRLAELTGPDGTRPGYTYSDLTQRLVPTAVMDAFPDSALTDEILLRTVRAIEPTPIFEENRVAP
ncbi:AAA family ATPase [Micromonospora sp. S4605]|uniref:AAA family ATPase n=1 Tax=Micromonospora sp. S4605 TaxID=1420897 RepID=UPI000D6F89DD|nr:ATP-binding protein [Micromonospora sp. S4605]PWU46302.1 AAA family ATPase [Micromonospora sp. S4605]